MTYVNYGDMPLAYRHLFSEDDTIVIKSNAWDLCNLYDFGIGARAGTWKRALFSPFVEFSKFIDMLWAFGKWYRAREFRREWRGHRYEWAGELCELSENFVLSAT